MLCEWISGEKMDKNDIVKRIQEEEDYIRCPKCSNSLGKFISKNSDGVKNATIAKLLMLTEEEVENIYQEIVQMLREDMVDNSSK